MADNIKELEEKVKDLKVKVEKIENKNRQLKLALKEVLSHIISNTESMSDIRNLDRLMDKLDNM